MNRKEEKHGVGEETSVQEAAAGKRRYVKPLITRHEAAAVVSGSSSGGGCIYACNTVGLTYYH
jgi:hypothetical protein